MNQDDIKQVAIMVAGILPAPWKFNHLYDQQRFIRYQIIGCHGMSFTMSADSYGNEGKFRIFGLGHSINASYDRQPKAIAMDIERRFIPEYLRLFEKQKQHKFRIRQENEQFDHIRNMFLKLIPGSHDRSFHSNKRNLEIVKSMSWNIDNNRDFIYIEANAYYLNRCQIKLDLSVDDGVRVVVFLNQLGIFNTKDED